MINKESCEGCYYFEDKPIHPNQPFIADLDDEEPVIFWAAKIQEEVKALPEGVLDAEIAA